MEQGKLSHLVLKCLGLTLIKGITMENLKTNNKNAQTEEFHTHCHDCGKFLTKKLWVSKQHPWKNHALCAECLSDYDGGTY